MDVRRAHFTLKTANVTDIRTILLLQHFSKYTIDRLRTKLKYKRTVHKESSFVLVGINLARKISRTIYIYIPIYCPNEKNYTKMKIGDKGLQMKLMVNYLLWIIIFNVYNERFFFDPIFLNCTCIRLSACSSNFLSLAFSKIGILFSQALMESVF